MEAEAEAAEEGRRKEREAAEEEWVKVWEAVVAEMAADAEAEEGEIEGEGAQAEEAAEARKNGDASKREGYGLVERKAGKKRKQQQQPVAAAGHASWWGRGGGRGRGGFRPRPRYGAKNLQYHKPNIFNKPGVYGGAIIICGPRDKREFVHQNVFCLPGYAATFIKKIRIGMLLFVFEREERKLCGVFEATSDGALNILPDAFTSFGKSRPAQIRFRRVWFCKPLMEAEFSDAIEGNYLKPQMSFFGISYQQVLLLVHLFASKRIWLQPYQKPKSRVIWDYKSSLAYSGLEFSLPTHNNAFPKRSSSMFRNNRISLPRKSFMCTKQIAKHDAYKYESPLYPQLKSVIFQSPDVKGESLEPNADYIPLELDDCKSDSETDRLETVNSLDYQDLKPFNGKFNEDDGYHSPVRIPGLHSENETSRNSVFSHIVKERQSSLQAKGCKRKAAVLQFDDHSSPRRGCSITKKVSFSFAGEEIPVTSDKALQMPASIELEQNRESFVEEGNQEVDCLAQNTQGKGEDVSAKKIKLTSLSFSEGHTNQCVHSCPRNSQSHVTQPGIKFTCTVHTSH